MIKRVVLPFLFALTSVLALIGGLLINPAIKGQASWAGVSGFLTAALVIAVVWVKMEIKFGSKKTQVTVVTVEYRNGSYYLRDSAGNYLQSCSVAGLRVVFGDRSGAYTIDDKLAAVTVADLFGLEIIKPPKKKQNR